MPEFLGVFSDPYTPSTGDGGHTYHRSDTVADQAWWPETPAWHKDAACKEHPELDWFPERGVDLAAQKMVCSGCPVRSECLEAGVGEHFGIWGGLSGRDRRRLRKARAGRQPRPTVSEYRSSRAAVNARYRARRRVAGHCWACCNSQHDVCRGGGCVCRVCAQRRAS